MERNGTKTTSAVDADANTDAAAVAGPGNAPPLSLGTSDRDEGFLFFLLSKMRSLTITDLHKNLYNAVKTKM